MLKKINLFLIDIAACFAGTIGLFLLLTFATALILFFDLDAEDYQQY
jgi:hypothetical protein